MPQILSRHFMETVFQEHQKVNTRYASKRKVFGEKRQFEYYSEYGIVYFIIYLKEKINILVMT